MSQEQAVEADVGHSSEEFDIDDPAKWPEIISSQVRTVIVRKGPVQIENFNFPKDGNNRRFTPANYVRVMPNKEKIRHTWLVYSKSTDTVFCFCCSLFSFNSATKLASTGYSNWRHLSQCLSQHEFSPQHIQCLQKWATLLVALKRDNTLNAQQQRIFDAEVLHWRNVLERLVACVNYLAKHNMTFRRSSDVIYTKNNGNFLGLVEFIAKFDPVMQEHVRRIRSDEIHDHYLGKDIQNELIDLLSSSVLKKILDMIKLAKYYSIILDCTPDVSHKEQMSVTIRCVHITEQLQVSIEEHFLGYINVMDTTGEALTSYLLSELENKGLSLADCRGQGYDNGSNMKGKKSGVQARVILLNPRAFFVPCGCHSLNLLLSDIAASSNLAVTFLEYCKEFMFSSLPQHRDGLY